MITGDSFDTQIVCLQCKNSPSSSSIEQLADHLQSTHQFQLANHTAIKMFISKHMAFEETLMSDDSDREMESDSSDKPDVLPNFYCPFCKSIFSSMTRLLCHLNQHLDLSIDNGVICCETIYNSKKLFVKHLQESHVTRPVDDSMNHCRTCGFQAETLQDLQDHVSRTHNKEEGSVKQPETSSKKREKNQKFIPAVCPECNKSFSNKYNMFIHMKSHSKVMEKYACDQCNRSYSSQGNLTSHKKLAHAGILNYVCTTCGEAFPYRLARDVHARIHTGEKPYSCEHCKKSFRAKNTLDRHIEMHLDIRKYACHLCPKKFRKRTHLNYHLKTHKGDAK